MCDMISVMFVLYSNKRKKNVP